MKRVFTENELILFVAGNKISTFTQTISNSTAKSGEEAFWQIIEDSSSIENFENYLVRIKTQRVFWNLQALLKLTL